jgi:hypothetical protein
MIAARQQIERGLISIASRTHREISIPEEPLGISHQLSARPGGPELTADS